MKLLLYFASFICPVFGAIVEDIKFQSHAMGGEQMPARVVLPSSYNEAKNAQKRYPSVYLLHGLSDTHRAWTSKGNAQALADQFQVIIVCPEGKQSWYLNHLANPKQQEEDHIIKELLPYVDKHYRTIPKREQRAISGVSMGGHGALWLASQHPDLFGAAGSFSGCVDLRPMQVRLVLGSILGEEAVPEERFEKHSVVCVLPKMKDKELKLIIHCAESDFLLPLNRDLHAQLKKENFSHQYIENSKGGHHWIYWSTVSPEQLRFFCNYFQGKS